MLSCIVFLVCLPVCGCGSKEEHADRSSAAARRHASMRASLHDSVALYTEKSLMLESKIDSAKKQFDELVSKMEATSPEEYVEIYRVLRGWRGYDTMAGTGIIARLLENGDVEVVASSASGPFSSVSLSAGGESVSTQPVKSGSGLNYTVGNVTRVTFIGADALALCDFAEAHEGDALTLTYNGSKTSVLKLTPSQAEMLSFFGRITAAKKQLDTYEKSYMVAFNKQMLYRSEVRKDSVAAATHKE